MTTQELFKEIEAAHAEYTKLFFKRLEAGAADNLSRSYKKMCESQRKIIEELVKMYWDAKQEDLYE